MLLYLSTRTGIEGSVGDTVYIVSCVSITDPLYPLYLIQESSSECNLQCSSQVRTGTGGDDASEDTGYINDRDNKKGEFPFS